MDFVGEVLAAAVAELAWTHLGLKDDATAEEILQRLPDWFSPTLAVEDLPDAYRSIPLHPEDSRACMVAVWCVVRNCWLFAESRSMLFGLSAAVD